jgi:hypothetical protein
MCDKARMWCRIPGKGVDGMQNPARHPWPGGVRTHSDVKEGTPLLELFRTLPSRAELG